MERIAHGGVERYTFRSLSPHPLVQGVFARLGGRSAPPYASLNVGHTVGDDARAVEANHRAIYAALGVEASRVVSARQVHGRRVAVVGADDGGKTLPETDALVTAVPGLVLLLRFADCVPVYLYAPRERVVGLAHAGWQGTLLGIAEATAREMVGRFGCRPEEMLAGLGPAIGPCCFEVGPEVIEPLRDARPEAATLLTPTSSSHARLDLWEANAHQLQSLGIEAIERATLCTSCRRDLFYSHRAEGGVTGRFAAVFGLATDGIEAS